MSHGTPENQQWLGDVVLAIEELGGEARLRDIYQRIQILRRNLPDNLEETVQATIYANSSDAKAYVSGNPDVFRHIERGVWGLRRSGEQVSGRSEDALRSDVMAEMSAEEWRTLGGDREAIKRFIQERVAAKKKKFHIP